MVSSYCRWGSIYSEQVTILGADKSLNDAKINRRATKASKALAMIRAKYRWCLTGTPVTNTLFVSHSSPPYIRDLAGYTGLISMVYSDSVTSDPSSTCVRLVKPIIRWLSRSDWDDFNGFIGKVQLSDAPLAGLFILHILLDDILTNNYLGLRAQEVLKPLMIRRTKNSELVILLSVS